MPAIHVQVCARVLFLVFFFFFFFFSLHYIQHYAAMAFSKLKEFTHSARDHKRSSKQKLQHIRQEFKAWLVDAYVSAQMLLWKVPPLYGLVCCSIVILYWTWFIISYVFRET